MASEHRRPGRQCGAALLALMLALFIVASAFWLKRGGSPDARAQRDRATAQALAQAKEALIGRAAADDNRPGSLTCPDIDNDGDAELFAGDKCPSYIGRVPWKTLDIPELLDGDGERLWYALSPALRDHENAQPINPGKALELSFDGVANVAAVVFSPGAPLAAQTGRPSNTVGDYLDGANADGDTAYASGARSATFNDRPLSITRDDVFRVVNRRVLAEIRGPQDPADGLRQYYAERKQFPLADTNGDGAGDSSGDGFLPYKDLIFATDQRPDAAGKYGDKAWLTNNAWLPLVKYRRTLTSAVNISLPINTLDSTTLDVQPCPSSPCP